MRNGFWSIAMLVMLAFACDRPARADDAGHDQWRAEIASLVAEDQRSPPPADGIVFVGSSSIRMWTSLHDDFPWAPVINRGFGGSMLADSTFFADKIIVPYRPRLVVVYAGDNDIAGGHSADQVFDDFKSFTARIHRDLPKTVVAFISIKPTTSREKLWPEMRRANDLIRTWIASQQRVAYVDVATPMLDAQGRPRPDLLREDGLHMNAAGYAIWIAALRPVMRVNGFHPR